MNLWPHAAVVELIIILRIYFTAVTHTEEFVHRPANVYYVEQEENYSGAEDTLQCIFTPPRDPTASNINYWKDCTETADCLATITENTAINDVTAYGLSYLEEDDLIHYNLTIKDVTLSSAGTYLCELKRGFDDLSQAKGRFLVIGE